MQSLRKRSKILFMLLALLLCFTLLPTTALAYIGINIIPTDSTPNTVSGYNYTFTVGETINLRFLCDGPTLGMLGLPSYTGTLPSGLSITNPSADFFSVAGTCTEATSGAVSATLSATSTDSVTATRDITITVNKATPTISVGAHTATLGTAKTVTGTLAGAYLASGDSFTFEANCGGKTVLMIVNANGSFSFDLSAALINALGMGSHSFAVHIFQKSGNADTNNNEPAVTTFTLTVNGVAPTITGNTTLTLTQGYAATSTGAYTITGAPAPTVQKTAGDAKINWNDTTKKLDIDAGLPIGTYPVTLTASNGVGTDATHTFTLKVKSASSPLPKTGDDFPLGGLLALMGITLTAMCWWFAASKRVPSGPNP